MIYTKKEYCLEVKGDMACFTRPEMKVERVSYDIITPSAARAIFEAIFWKPAIRWNITRIEVLNPIRWLSIKRNEVGSLMSPRLSGLFIEDNRQQKSSLLLKNVCYRIFAEQEFIPIRYRTKKEKLKISSEPSDENPAHPIFHGGSSFTFSLQCLHLSHDRSDIIIISTNSSSLRSTRVIRHSQGRKQ